MFESRINKKTEKLHQQEKKGEISDCLTYKKMLYTSADETNGHIEKHSKDFRKDYEEYCKLVGNQSLTLIGFWKEYQQKVREASYYKALIDNNVHPTIFLQHYQECANDLDQKKNELKSILDEQRKQRLENFLGDLEMLTLMKNISCTTKKAPTSGRLVEMAKEMQQHDNAMWRRAVHPVEFKETFQKVLDDYGAAKYPNPPTEEGLALWDSNRKALADLVEQLKKKSDQIREDVERDLPKLVGKARDTIKRLKQLKKRVQQDQSMAKASIEHYIECYENDNHAPMQEENSLLRLYAGLSYDTRTLSSFIEKFNKRGDKSETRKSLEYLLQKVSELDIRMYHDEQELADAIYILYYTVDTFSHQNDDIRLYPDSERARLGTNRQVGASPRRLESLSEITPPEGVRKVPMHQYAAFWNDNAIKVPPGINLRRRRLAINCDPYWIATVSNDLVQGPPDSAYALKAIEDEIPASKSLNNIWVYYYDFPSSNEVVAKWVVAKCRGYIRPDRPAMMERIDSTMSGIGSADNTPGIDFGRTRTNPIAAVAWKLHEEDKHVNRDKLLPKVEEAYRAKGIDPDDPQWNTN